MWKITLIALLPLMGFLYYGLDHSQAEIGEKGRDGYNGTLEKLIVANGSVTMDLNLARLNGTRSRAKGGKTSTLRFEVPQDSFFTLLVFNDELRGPLASSMPLVPQDTAALPAKLTASYRDLVIENLAWGGPAEMVVRDGKTGFTFFTIEGQEFDYNPVGRSFNASNGRLLISKEFAAELNRPADERAIVGGISFAGTMRPIEISQIVDGEIRSDSMPSIPSAGTVPGPDVIVGDLSALQQFGSAGTQVGLAVATDSCNFGTEPLNWLRLPDNDHPVIPQNLYRMSGGSGNDERFEQIGQSNVKHGFTALQENICGLGCVANTDGNRLGSGCSDPYSASLNAGPNLGSRAWINPFTGAFPRGDSATPPNNHGGHTHNGVSHRLITEVADLNTASNAGASYYVESSYVTPHEYNWCQSHPGQCNMYNNTSYRKYNVSGTTGPFSFSPAAATVRMQPAVNAWPGATKVEFRPDPGNDGFGIVGYKVTNPSPGVWHYEYAIYNQNLDRGIQSFSIPVGTGVTITNFGFHAPPQQPGWAADGTMGNAGYSNTPWTQTQAAGSVTWSSETIAQNPNANAIRWATLYNIRFDSNTAPGNVQATIGFFKTGSPVNVAIQAPGGTAPTPTPTPTPTATPTPTPTPTPNPGVCTPTLTITETFPGSMSAFDSVTAGANSVTVDAASGAGLQGLSLVSSVNASVNIPSFAIGTTTPVTTTFSITTPGQPVNFTLRASSRRNTIEIRATCTAGPNPTPTATPTPNPTPTPTATPTATPTPNPTATPTPTPTPTATPTPTPTPNPGGPCTPTLTFTEVSPGSLAAFDSITAGPGSVIVDAAASGAGLQGLLLGNSSNATVNVPSFTSGTTAPVTVTFAATVPGQPVDFTLRASSRRNVVDIRARCTAALARATDDASFWIPTQTGTPFDGLLSLVRYALGGSEAAVEETAVN